MAADHASRFGTIRARTTISATLVVGLALATAGVALVALVHRSLVNNVDHVAESRAEDVAALVRQDTLPSVIAAEEDAVVQVVDDDGTVVASTSSVLGKPPVATLRPSGEDVPALMTLNHVTGEAGRYRLLALAATSKDGRDMTVLVATSLEQSEATTFLVRSGLLVACPLLLALVALITWTTVGRALRPVESIRAQVADVSEHDLARRVPVSGTDDEIARLAQTMNAMLDRLQAGAEKQRRFVADASHELRTPLAAARADLEVAIAHPDATSWNDTAKDLLTENIRMEQLVSDLLYIARSDGSPPAVATTPVDLHEVVLEEAGRLGGTGTTIDVSEVGQAFVRGDRDELTRAIRNLIDNARRHAASEVVVALAQNGATVELSIADDGPGVPVADRERIFERFTRLDQARGRATGGAGLGLAIVSDIVDRHSGTVSVEDAAPGARFVVRLPSD